MPADIDGPVLPPPGAPNTFVEFPLPGRASAVKRIAVDPSNPNRVWWCGSNRAGYVEVIE